MNGALPKPKSSPGQLRAVIFDFDGTLATLEIDFGQMRDQVLALAAQCGLAPTDFAGQYLLEGLATATAALGRTAPQAARDLTMGALALIEKIELEAAGRGRIFSFTRPALASLNRAGFRLAVITRNCGPAVLRVFPDLTRQVEVFLPREAVSAVKPNPAHITAALSALGLPPEEALMVGDHPIDVHTGQVGGTFTAAVASGRVPKAELAAAGADLLFDHVGQLAEYLVQTKSRKIFSS